MFKNMTSDSILQLTFKKQPLVEFWYSIKEDPQLSEKAIKIFLPSPTTYLWQGQIWFSLYFNPDNLLQQV